MRVITWNLNNAGSTRERDERVWDFIFNKLKADIALLQEVQNPSSKLSILGLKEEQFIWKPVNNSWGTAIYTKEGNLHEVEVSGFRKK